LPTDQRVFLERPSYWWQPNKTINQLADLFRVQVAAADVPCGDESASRVSLLNEQALTKVEALRKRMTSPLSFVQPNRIGNVMLSVTVASFSDIKTNFCEVVQTIAGQKVE
jgi:hypothetical protein